MASSVLLLMVLLPARLPSAFHPLSHKSFPNCFENPKSETGKQHPHPAKALHPLERSVQIMVGSGRLEAGSQQHPDPGDPPEQTVVKGSPSDHPHAALVQFLFYFFPFSFFLFFIAIRYLNILRQKGAHCAVVCTAVPSIPSVPSDCRAS